MTKKGQIIKISKGEMTDITLKDITYKGKNVNTSAGVNINETGKSGVFYSK